MKFFVREILDATPRSRAAGQGGSRKGDRAERPWRAGWRPTIEPPIHAHDPTRLRHDMSGTFIEHPTKANFSRSSRLHPQAKKWWHIPFAIGPTKRAAFAALSKCDKRRQRVCRHLMQC